METNKVVEIKRKTALQNSRPAVQAAIDAGDHQACFDALTTKQQQFCLEYLKDLNAARAVVRAGYKTSTNANRVGWELLDKPGVQFALQGLMARRAEKQELDANYVLQKVIKMVEDNEGKNPTVAMRGLENLMKHLGMFIERQEISGPDGNAIELERRTQQEADAFKSSIARLASAGGANDDNEPDEPGDTAKA